MQKFISKYLKILDLEMDDLESDIEFLISKYEERKQKHEITDYVFLENLAVLKNEMCGISSFKQIISSIDPREYTTIEDLIRDIKAKLKKRIEDCGLVQVLFPLIERKLDKVYTYVQQSD